MGKVLSLPGLSLLEEYLEGVNLRLEGHLGLPRVAALLHLVLHTNMAVPVIHIISMNLNLRWFITMVLILS